jgi:hypothetical protein
MEAHTGKFDYLVPTLSENISERENENTLIEKEI